MRSIPPGAQAEPEKPTARPGASPWTRWAIIYLALSIMEVQPPLLLFLLALGKVQQIGGIDPVGMLALVLAAFALFAAGHGIAAASSRSPLVWRLWQPLFGVVAVAIVALLAWAAPPAVTLIDIPPALLDATIIVWLGLRARSFLRYQRAGAEATQEWVMQSLRIGLIAFAAALVLAIIFDVPQALSGIALLPAYLLGGFVASAALRSIALQQIAAQDDQPPEGRPWTLLAGGIGVVCALAFFGGGLLGTQQFAGVVTPVFQTLATGAQWLGNGIVSLFSWISSLLGQLFPDTSTSTRSTTSTQLPSTSHIVGGGFPTWVYVFSFLLWLAAIIWLIRSWWRSRRPLASRRQIRIPLALVIVLFIILLLILLAPLFLTAMPSTSTTPSTTTTTHPATSPHVPIILLLVIIGLVILAILTVLAWHSLQVQEEGALRNRMNWLATLRQLLARLRWRRARSGVAFEQRYPTTSEQGEAESLPSEATATLAAEDDETIRATYRHMLSTAARAGRAWARQPAETPAEYARRLHTLMATQPDGPAQMEEAGVTLDTLTDAYRQARYGGQPPDTTTRMTIAGRLSRLLAIFRKL